MKCISCKCTAYQKPLFRTNSKGQPDPGWMCESCIIKLHDKSLIEEDKDFANELFKVINIKK